MQQPTIPEDEGREDFESEPLVGLTPKPAHLMSESDWREYVVEVHNVRQSFQTFKAKVTAEANSKPTPKQTKGLAELLEEF